MRSTSLLRRSLVALLICALLSAVGLPFAAAATPGDIHNSIYGTQFDKLTEDIQLPVAKDGDLSMDSAPTASDKETPGLITLRVPLRYKGSTNVKNSLSLFEVIPQVTEDWPFEVLEAVVLTLDQIQSASPETPFEPKDYIELTFRVRDDAVNGVYPIALKIRYLDIFQDRFFDTPAASTLTTYVRVTRGKKAEEPSNPSTSPKPVTRPVLLLESFSTNPDPALAGNEFDLTLVLKNTSDTRDIGNVTCKITEAENTILPATGSSTFFVPSVKAGKTAEITLRMKAQANAGIQPAQFTLDMSYEDKDFNSLSAEESFVLPVFQELKLEADEPRYDASFTSGDSAYLYMNLYNKGKSTVYNVMVRLESAFIQLEENYFAGNMEAGSTRTLDTYIIERTGAAEASSYDAVRGGKVMFSSSAIAVPMPVPEVEPSPSDMMPADEFYEGSISDEPLNGPVPDAKLVVTYEDKDGNESRMEVPLSIAIYQPAPPDIDVFDPTIDMPEAEPNGMPTWGWIAIGVGAVLLLVVGIVLIVKARKRKEALEDEME